MYDVVIRHAQIVDGTGNPWFRGDVAIAGTSIAAVGRVTGDAARVIDASQLCVCPGFIDVHAHGDFTPFDKTVVDYKLRQGITTEVNGNCGFSAAPLDPATADLVKRSVVGFIAPEQGVPWNWCSLGEYLETIAQAQLAINIAPLIGHGALRAAAMGYEQRAPTPAELDKMKALLQESMEQGAFGLWKKGIVRQGMDADLVLFEPHTIAERSSYRDPHQYPVGLPYVILNSQVTADQGRFSGTLAGRVVRRQA